MGTRRVVLSLALALLVNAMVALGAAVAAAAVEARQPGGSLIEVAVSSVKGSAGLRPEDLAAITNQFRGEASISPVASRMEPFSFDSVQATVTVEGVVPNFARLAAWHIDEGSFFTSQDEATLKAVAVVSKDFAPNAAVGATIRIRDTPFTIVGIGSGSWPSKTVLVPLRTAQIRLFGPTALDQVFLQVDSTAGDSSSTLTRQLESLLRTRHNLRSGQVDDFTISNVQLGAPVQSTLSETRVLRIIQQFACSAKSACLLREVN